MPRLTDNLKQLKVACTNQAAAIDLRKHYHLFCPCKSLLHIVLTSFAVSGRVMLGICHFNSTLNFQNSQEFNLES